jgi:hypothetical protein
MIVTNLDVSRLYKGRAREDQERKPPRSKMTNMSINQEATESRDDLDIKIK